MECSEKNKGIWSIPIRISTWSAFLFFLSLNSFYSSNKCFPHFCYDSALWTENRTGHGQCLRSKSGENSQQWQYSSVSDKRAITTGYIISTNAQTQHSMCPEGVTYKNKIYKEIFTKNLDVPERTQGLEWLLIWVLVLTLWGLRLSQVNLGSLRLRPLPSPTGRPS